MIGDSTATTDAATPSFMDKFAGYKDIQGVQHAGWGSTAANTFTGLGNLYLGYQGLREARRNREMQERLARVNLANQANAYNQNLDTIARNSGAINQQSPEQVEAFRQRFAAQGTF